MAENTEALNAARKILDNMNSEQSNAVTEAFAVLVASCGNGVEPEELRKYADAMTERAPLIYG